MHVGIIGAGPAGITAAYQLAKKGVSVDVYEAGPAVGGLARTIDLWGQRVDLGPHRFFSTDRRVNALWLEVVGRDYSMVDRLTRIYYGGRFFSYPLRIFNALRLLGPVEAAQCLGSYVQERLSPTEQDGSFEDWVVHQFGRRLFEIFFKSYSEKLWGISCKELDADFASQRIKKLSLAEAIFNAIKQGRGNRHKTLVDRFAYPHLGSGIVYERMAEAITRRGGRLFLDRPVRRVVPAGDAVQLELESGETAWYDHVVSSMPLTLMVQRLPDVPDAIREHAAALRFRNTTLVYLQVEGDAIFPDNWIYVHDPALQFGRITNFRNWTPQLHGPRGESILALEYWSYDEDALWAASDDDLIALARREIGATGLLGERAVLAGHVVRIRRCYPVYDRDYKRHLRPIEQYLQTIPNVTAIGRYGAFKYNNQDHSILMGILAAERIADDANHSLWDINTDYDTYQEGALITETGLQEL
ncbi:MAG: FAD-dependent oxidoreductase [Rhodothermales bacterium]